MGGAASASAAERGERSSLLGGGGGERSSSGAASAAYARETMERVSSHLSFIMGSDDEDEGGVRGVMGVFDQVRETFVRRG